MKILFKNFLNKSFFNFITEMNNSYYCGLSDEIKQLLLTYKL